jgi:ketosteroid isomerase-like protein
MKGHDMKPDVRRGIEWDCAQILTRFINALDDGDYETMASLMAPDGVWRRPDGDAVGPDGLLTDLNNRPRNLLIRHVISNTVIDVVDENFADGIGPPPQSWSTVIVRKRRIRDGEQTTQTGRDRHEVTAG